jgi:hypothetical protein
MYKHLTRTILIPAIAVGLLMFSHSAQAQGTATGPITSHIVDPGPIVVIGDPASPIPIDLDITGPPWLKNIADPFGNIIGGGPLDLNETIINVGNEPWLDWHEHILPDATGIVPGLWVFVDMTINGNPITFNAVGLGTPDLWLDTFSQPVFPGDVLNVRKIIDATPGPALLQMRIAEYPTPEPASAALIGIGSLLLVARRKASS